MFQKNLSHCDALLTKKLLSKVLQTRSRNSFKHIDWEIFSRLIYNRNSILSLQRTFIVFSIEFEKLVIYFIFEVLSTLPFFKCIWGWSFSLQNYRFSFKIKQFRKPTIKAENNRNMNYIANNAWATLRSCKLDERGSLNASREWRGFDVNQISLLQQLKFQSRWGI